jgi:hypothetical protein
MCVDNMLHASSHFVGHETHLSGVETLAKKDVRFKINNFIRDYEICVACARLLV